MFGLTRRPTAQALTPPALGGWAAALLLFTTGSAHAHALSSELTVGASFVGVSFNGDLELRPDETFLTACYAGAKSSAYSSFAHQLCAGVDQAFGDHWLGSVMGHLSPASVTPVRLSAVQVFRSITSGAGATVSAAYSSGAFDFLEWGADLSAHFTAHRLVREVETEGGQKLRRQTGLMVGRLSGGLAMTVDLDTELSLRGTYWIYSQDPVLAGRVTDRELDQLLAIQQSRVERLRLTAEQTRAALAFFSDRLSAADAATGLPSAPVWFELRAQGSYRFNKMVRLQVSYTFDRYVPSEGVSHILSAKAWFRIVEAFRLWVAGGAQWDVRPAEEGEARPPAQLLPLFSVGAEYTF